MPKKYHVITTKQKIVIYWHGSIESLRKKICEMLLCPDHAILTIREL